DGARVIDDNGKKGDANNRVITALAEHGNIIARSRVKHQYPHSWRSKKPVIFRNTPQWFVYMDKPIAGSPSSGVAPTASIPLPLGETGEGAPDTLRNRALAAIDATRFYP